jgi:hypothetical protein
MQDVLNWPGQWVAGHLGEPGLAIPSSTQGAFSSSSSGPKGFKGAVGQFNNNGVTGIVDENGHIRTINHPFATASTPACELSSTGPRFHQMTVPGQCACQSEGCTSVLLQLWISEASDSLDLIRLGVFLHQAAL